MAPQPSPTPSVFLIATLDTQGGEAALVRQRLLALGIATTLLDAGALGAPTVAADIREPYGRTT